MKNAIAHILIACLLALSLHGFGTDEHGIKAASGEIVLVDSDSGKNKTDSTAPQMGGACDICQVVHHYVVASQEALPVPAASRLVFARAGAHPPDNRPGGLLRPPTA